MGGRRRDLLRDLPDDRQVVPHAVVVVVAGALALVVGPVGVHVRDVDEQVLAGSGEEGFLDVQYVAVRMLRAVGRLLGRVGDVGTVQHRLGRHTVVAETVQGATRTTSEVSGGLGEVDRQRLRRGGRS